MEEESRKLTLEDVGLGKTSNAYNHQIFLLSALIFNAVGLVISLIVFVIELIIHKTMSRCTENETQDRLEVDYQGGEEPSLSVVKTVLDVEQEEKDKSEQNDCVEEGKDY